MRTIVVVSVLFAASSVARAETGRIGAFAISGGYLQSAAEWQAGVGLSGSIVLLHAPTSELVLEASVARQYMRVDNPRSMAFGAWNTTAIPTLQLHVTVRDGLVIYPLVGAGLWTSSASQDCSLPPDGDGSVCDAFPLWEDTHLIGRAGVGARIRIGKYDLVAEPDVDYVFGRMTTGNQLSISTRVGVLATF
jgi:hypothetical protein